jgi:hypothetical protein
MTTTAIAIPPRRLLGWRLLERLQRYFLGGTQGFPRYTGGGGYLPTTWYFTDSAVDLDFENDRYFVSDTSADSNLVLLMHADGTDPAAVFPDATGRHQITAVGNAQIDNGQSKFGGTSALFDGSGDYLDVVSNLTDFAFGLGDFTIDFWVRVNATGVTYSFFDGRVASPTEINLVIYKASSDEVRVWVNGNRIFGSTALVTGAFYHVALVRQSGSTKLFINGVQEGSTYSDTNNYLGGACRIGTDFDGTNPFNGWIDEVRVRRDAAWTSNFTPSASAYSDPTPTGPYFALSCSRASTGYATTSAGTLTSFAANTLRRTDLGLLVEDARTNLALQSADASTSWTATNITVTANQSIAPDGSTTMDKLDDGTSAGRHIIEQSVTAPANTIYTVSAFVKDVDRRYVSLVWASTTGRIGMVADLQLGTVTKSGIIDTLGDTVFTSASIEGYNNGVYRLSLTGVADAAQTTLYFDVALSDTGTPTVYVSGCPSYTGSNKSVYVWGMQIEQGAFPSSYITTTSASATRAADVVESLGALTSVTTGTAKTFVADLTTLTVPTGFWRILPNQGGDEEFAGSGGGVNTSILAWNGSTQLGPTTLGNSLTFSGGVKVGASQDGSGRSVGGGGGTIASDANTMTATALRLGYGANASVFSYMYFRRLTAWDTRLSDGTLQSRTAP